MHQKKNRPTSHSGEKYGHHDAGRDQRTLRPENPTPFAREGNPHPPSVRIIDFGIRSLDLTYALLDNYDAVILIDAAPR